MSVAARHPMHMALAGLTLVAGALLAGPAVAAEPAFGTAPVVAGPSAAAAATVTAVETGRHAGFDRVVFRVSGPTLRYEVRYASSLVEDPTGTALPLAGSAVLTVTLRSTTWIDAPSPRLNRTVGFPALRQVRSAGEFEAVVSYGLGQTGRDGFRVFRLTGPDRIVVDLRHPSVAASPPGTPAPGGSAPGAGAGPGSGASSAPASEPVPTAEPVDGTEPAPASEPVDGTDEDFPLPALVVGVLAVGLLAAAGIALRLR
jgi:hypothetical protein